MTLSVATMPFVQPSARITPVFVTVDSKEMASFVTVWKLVYDPVGVLNFFRLLYVIAKIAFITARINSFIQFHICSSIYSCIISFVGMETVS